MLNVDIEDWDRAFAINVRGPYLVTAAFIPLLARASEKAGREIASVVNISSVRDAIEPQTEGRRSTARRDRRDWATSRTTRAKRRRIASVIVRWSQTSKRRSDQTPSVMTSGAGELRHSARRRAQQAIDKSAREHAVARASSASHEALRAQGFCDGAIEKHADRVTQSPCGSKNWSDVPAGRPASARDLVQALISLATAEYANGQNVAIDGGWLLTNM